MFSRDEIVVRLFIFVSCIIAFLFANKIHNGFFSIYTRKKKSVNENRSSHCDRKNLSTTLTNEKKKPINE